MQDKWKAKPSSCSAEVPAARQKLGPNQEKFFNWCLNQDHNPYDAPQAIKSALDLMDKALGSASPTLNRKIFPASSVRSWRQERLRPPINASEVTPIDLCNFNIFEQDYFQIAGTMTEIKSYNSIDPQTWAISTNALHAVA